MMTWWPQLHRKFDQQNVKKTSHPVQAWFSYLKGYRPETLPNKTNLRKQNVVLRAWGLIFISKASGMGNNGGRGDEATCGCFVFPAFLSLHVVRKVEKVSLLWLHFPSSTYICICSRFLKLTSFLNCDWINKPHDSSWQTDLPTAGLTDHSTSVDLIYLSGTQ